MGWYAIHIMGMEIGKPEGGIGSFFFLKWEMAEGEILFCFVHVKFDILLFLKFTSNIRAYREYL